MSDAAATQKPTQEQESHLEICDCGKHGRIRFKDSRASPEFCFKKYTYEALAHAVVMGLLDVIESGKLRGEIKALSFPEDHTEIPAKFLWRINSYNVLFAQDLEVGIDIHEYLNMEDNEDVPPSFLWLLNDRYGAVHPGVLPEEMADATELEC